MVSVLMTILYLVVIGFLGRASINSWRPGSEGRKASMATLKAIRWWMLPAGVVAIILVLAAFSYLWSFPVFHLSWWSLFAQESQGNILAGPRVDSKSSLLTVGMALAIPLLLVVNIPRFAFMEEATYRMGCEEDDAPKFMLRALVFGLIHMVVGVPLAAGLALSIGGIYFGLVYLHSYKKVSPQLHQDLVKVMDEAAAGNEAEALKTLDERLKRELTAQATAVTKAAAAHTVYNGLAISLLLFSLWFILLGG